MANEKRFQQICFASKSSNYFQLQIITNYRRIQNKTSKTEPNRFIVQWQTIFSAHLNAMKTNIVYIVIVKLFISVNGKNGRNWYINNILNYMNMCFAHRTTLNIKNIEKVFAFIFHSKMKEKKTHSASIAIVVLMLFPFYSRLFLF